MTAKSMKAETILKTPPIISYIYKDNIKIVQKDRLIPHLKMINACAY
jgi:hypothetical protein